MTYGRYLVHHPLFWSLLAGLAVGAALAAVTRNTRRAARPYLAKSRKWTLTWLSLSVAVAAIAAGLIVPSDFAVLNPRSVAAAGMGLAIGMLGLRFPRAFGVPILLIVTGAAVMGAIMVRDYVPVRASAGLARFTVLSIRDTDISFEVVREMPGPAGEPSIVSIPGRSIRVAVDVLDVSDALFLLGAGRFVRFIGPESDEEPAPGGIIELAIDRGMATFARSVEEISEINVLRTYRLIVEPSARPRFVFTSTGHVDDTVDEMMITLYKTDPKERIHYYSINDRQGHLFSSHTFTVNWGPALTAGREKVYSFESRAEMDRKLQLLIRERIRNGYRVLYTYFRAREYPHLRSVLRKAAVS
jgi:predicted DNA-binding WGR domain protein